MAMEINKLSINNMQMEYLLAGNSVPRILSGSVHGEILTLPEANFVFFVARYLQYLQTSLKAGELEVYLGDVRTSNIRFGRMEHISTAELQGWTKWLFPSCAKRGCETIAFSATVAGRKMQYFNSYSRNRPGNSFLVQPCRC